MGKCISCQVSKKKPNLDLQAILNLIYFNVGKIVYLQQVKPLEHHYSLEIITGDLMVVTNQTTGHSETVNKEKFIELFGTCSWAKLEAVAW